MSPKGALFLESRSRRKRHATGKSLNPQAGKPALRVARTFLSASSGLPAPGKDSRDAPESPVPDDRELALVWVGFEGYCPLTQSQMFMKRLLFAFCLTALVI